MSGSSAEKEARKEAQLDREVCADAFPSFPSSEKFLVIHVLWCLQVFVIAFKDGGLIASGGKSKEVVLHQVVGAERSIERRKTKKKMA